MTSFDLVIRGGTVIDGTGAEPRTADVAISGGRIAAVEDEGRLDGGAARTVEADGAIVTPGFVDIHTHYDGQATWDTQLLPSPWHGVTTVLMGNCGVGFAPVRRQDRDRLIELMEGVEDIPGAALHEGLAWDWESFPDYLDAVERKDHYIDLAAQVPHGALRLYVMGERGANREAATAEEIVRMGELVRQAVEAGALGFSTSRTLNHRTSRGEPTPTLTAAEAELVGIAESMGQAGAGVLEVVSDFLDVDAEFAILRRMVEASGRPLSFSVLQADQLPGQWRQLLAHLTEANADGLEIRGQVGARAVGVLLGLQATMNPFATRPSYRAIADLSLAERLRTFRDPAFRSRLLSEESAGKASFFHRFDKMFRLGDPPDYEPAPETSVAAQAARLGCRPEELAYDIMLEDEGRAFLYFPILNYGAGDLEAVKEMHEHANTVPGLSDGGAHVGSICDASFPTTMLIHWGRDRWRGGRLDLARIVAAQTHDTAVTVGLHDRGVLAPGMKADINVIDFDHLTLRPPAMSFDLPAGGKRLLQRADGYLHTFVSGEEVYASGEHTGALPGRLIRGAQQPG